MSVENNFPTVLEHSAHWPIPTGGNANTQGRAQISASNDLEAVLCFLAEYSNSKNTLSYYRKEIERFMLWLYQEWRGISDVTREDIHRYSAFLADPQPAFKWCGPRRARKSPDWKPFVAGLSPASIRQSMLCLQSLFAYLTDAGYLIGNPFNLARKVRREGAQDARANVRSRLLDPEVVQMIMDFVLHGQPNEADLDSAEKRSLVRDRVVLGFFLTSGARASECCATMATDIYCVREAGQPNWWWRVTGKGGKQAEVPVPPELIAVIRQYRALYQLPMPAQQGEGLPLVLPLRWDGKRKPKRLDRKTTYLIVTNALAALAGRMEANGKLEHAELTRKASPHWLRHAYAKWLLTHGVDLVTAMRNLRHGSLDTTMIYDDDLINQRHKSTMNAFKVIS